MNLPEDTPEWAEKAFSSIEEQVEDLVTKSQTADSAMKAAGAYWMWKKLVEAVEDETRRQENAKRNKIRELNARRNADA